MDKPRLRLREDGSVHTRVPDGRGGYELFELFLANSACEASRVVGRKITDPRLYAQAMACHHERQARYHLKMAAEFDNHA